VYRDAVGPGAVIAIGVGGFALVAAFIVIGYQVRKRRIQEWQQLASSLGLQFSTEDPFALVDLPFHLFKEGEGQGTENVMWGTSEGLDLKAFEFWFYTESTSTSTNGGMSTHRDYSYFSCVLVPAPVVCPNTTIGPEGLMSKLGHLLGFHDIDFESEDFNRAMKVKSADPKFANYLIDARMMQWLLETKGWQFELNGTDILTYCRRVRPLEMPNVIAAAEGFRAHIPEVVEDTYKEH